MRELGAARGRTVDDDEADVIARALAGDRAVRRRRRRPRRRCASAAGGSAILTNCDDDLFAETRARMPVPIDEAVTAERCAATSPSTATSTSSAAASQPDAWVHAANSWVHDVGAGSRARPAPDLGRPRLSGHDASRASVRIEDFARLADEADRLAG